MTRIILRLAAAAITAQLTLVTATVLGRRVAEQADHDTDSVARDSDFRDLKLRR